MKVGEYITCSTLMAYESRDPVFKSGEPGIKVGGT